MNIIIDLPTEYNKIVDFLEFQHIGLLCEMDELPKDTSYFSQLNLSEKLDKLTPGKLKDLLHKNRQNYHFITVEPLSKKLAALAARDGRVDGVRITTNSRVSTFNLRYARRIAENGKMIVVDFQHLGHDFKASIIRPLLRIIEAMKRARIPFIPSTRPEEPEECKTYKSLQALGELLGIDKKITDPSALLDLVATNEKKISGKIPFPGIELEEK